MTAHGTLPTTLAPSQLPEALLSSRKTTKPAAEVRLLVTLCRS